MVDIPASFKAVCIFGIIPATNFVCRITFSVFGNFLISSIIRGSFLSSVIRSIAKYPISLTSFSTGLSLTNDLHSTSFSITLYLMSFFLIKPLCLIENFAISACKCPKFWYELDVVICGNVLVVTISNIALHSDTLLITGVAVSNNTSNFFLPFLDISMNALQFCLTFDIFIFLCFNLCPSSAMNRLLLNSERMFLNIDFPCRLICE